MAKGTWFRFVLYKPTAGGKNVQAKLVEFWAHDESTALAKIGKLYPDYQQWFVIQTSWWKVLAGLFTFGKVIRWKW